MDQPASALIRIGMIPTASPHWPSSSAARWGDLNGAHSGRADAVSKSYYIIRLLLLLWFYRLCALRRRRDRDRKKM
jgi:hypothetical protein